MNKGLQIYWILSFIYLYRNYHLQNTFTLTLSKQREGSNNLMHVIERFDIIYWNLITWTLHLPESEASELLYHCIPSEDECQSSDLLISYFLHVSFLVHVSFQDHVSRQRTCQLHCQPDEKKRDNPAQNTFSDWFIVNATKDVYKEG